MTDIDHFKRFNDSYGHLTGDQVLRLVAHEVKQNVKGQDIAARYGGEEFVIVLPNTVAARRDHGRRPHPPRRDEQGTDEALDRRESRTRDDLGRRRDPAQGRHAPRSLIERADSCLYAAKRIGRNRVISEADPETLPAPRQQGGVVSSLPSPRSPARRRWPLRAGAPSGGRQRRARPGREFLGIVVEAIGHAPIGRQRRRALRVAGR